MLLSVADRIIVRDTVKEITWLELPSPPKTPAEKQDAEDDLAKPNQASEPIWTMPDVPTPDVEVPPPPDFQGLGRMLNNCKLENFSYLTPLEKQRCAGVMAAKPRLLPSGQLPKPYRAQKEDQWTRERAEQNKPKTLPCFGEGGFNPLAPGCLTPSE